MTEIINAIDELIEISNSIGDPEFFLGLVDLYAKRNELIKLIKDYSEKECNCGRKG